MVDWFDAFTPVPEHCSVLSATLLMEAGEMSVLPWLNVGLGLAESADENSKQRVKVYQWLLSERLSRLHRFCWQGSFSLGKHTFICRKFGFWLEHKHITHMLIEHPWLFYVMMNSKKGYGQQTDSSQKVSVCKPLCLDVTISVPTYQYRFLAVFKNTAWTQLCLINKTKILNTSLTAFYPV